ncbi:MAG: UDP-N-acetylmuramate dehydrogenase [Lachnospiraceae bacterium]|nr:UDP-N-acetylmuramate dehydrogenase [Lachnospiraceae bacterium]
MNEMKKRETADLLRKAAPEAAVRTDERMAEHTTFRTGGPAAVFVEPASAEDIKSVIRICRETGTDHFVLGRGSNLLVSDSGYDGVVIHIADSMSDIACYDDVIKAEAGASLAAIAAAAKKNSLTGLEFAGGIPGSLGGGLRMNAGAYGGELKDVLVSAVVMDKDGNISEQKLEDLGMRYRGSRIADDDLIALSGVFRLHPGDITEITEYMQELAGKRRSRQPLEYPSAGSTFKRPEGYFAGKLIEDAGLKGFRVGGACVSEKHCGFVVNDRNGTSQDVLAVMRAVREKVLSEYGVLLEPEVRFLGNGMEI